MKRMIFTALTAITFGGIGFGQDQMVNGNLIVDDVDGSHSSIRLGHELNDRVIVDNNSNKPYGGGYFFRVHDNTVGYKYRDVMTLAENGNVGIGIRNPVEKLHVNGNIGVPFTWSLKDIQYNRPILKSGWLTGVGDYIEMKHGGGNTEANTWGLRISDVKGLEFGRNNFTNNFFNIGLNGNIGVPFVWTLKDAEYDRPILKSGWLTGVGDYIEMKHGGENTEANTWGLRISDAKGLEFGRNNFTEKLFNVDLYGKVGIGTTSPDEKLTVKGKIHAEEVRVDLSVPADYVFEKYYTGESQLKADYIMPTLEEVEAFTKENNHLPSIPSAQEIQEEGLHLKEMTNLLLQKIEELTLYTIEQQKEIKTLKAKVTQLEKSKL